MSRALPPPALAGIVLLWGSVLCLAFLGPDLAQLPTAIAAYSAGFLVLLHLWSRHGEVLDDPRLLLGGAVVLRLTLFPALPDLSDDLYRYVWDGWLLVSGISPYRFVPADEALQALHADFLFPLLNSPAFHSVYPPLSQLIFAPAGWAYEVFGWPTAAFVAKGGFLLLETAGVFLLYRALRTLGRPARHLALYAWNPLVLVVVAGGGHTEGGMVLGMGILALGVAAQAPRTAWIGLVLAGLVTGIPLVLAPLLLRYHLGRMGTRQALTAPLPALGLGAVLTLPFLPGGMLEAALRSADLYVRLFEFNAGLYFLAKEAGMALTGEDPSKVIGPAFRLAFLAAAAGVWVRWPVGTARDLLRGCLVLLGLYLVLATTVHPWYLVWGLVLVPFTSLTRGAWMWASWAAFPTYLTYVGASHGLLAGVFWGGAALFLAAEGWPRLRGMLLPLAGARKARQIRGRVVGKRVLDLGAGEGWVGWHLHREGPGERTVVLADPDPGFQVQLPAVVCRGEALPFPARSLDTVILSLVLHHTNDPDRVLAEALRVARSRVVITESVYRRKWERRLLERVDRWVNRGRGRGRGQPGDVGWDQETLRFRRAEEWEEAARSLGGQVVESRRLNRLGHRHHLVVVTPGEPG